MSDSSASNLAMHVLGTILVLAMAVQSVRYLVGAKDGKPLPRSVNLRRVATYLLTMLTLGVSAALIVAWGVWQPGGLAAMGLVAPRGWAMWLTLVLALAAVAVPVVAGIAFWNRAELREEWREETIGTMDGILLDLMPRGTREFLWFLLLTLHASIAEEIIVRGFLHHWMSGLVGWIPSMILTSLLFGGAHAYQGLSGVWKTAAFGVGLVLLREWTGTLWAPIAVHVGVNACSGTVAFVFLSRDGEPGSPADGPDQSSCSRPS